MRILLVEDDREVAGYLRRGLEEENNSVTVCFDGAAGLRAAQSSAFDIVILDVMLPYLDGFQVTKRLRLESVRTPILLLTARDAPEDIVRGLDAGADDYLTKPFSFNVLLARLRARTRSPDRRHTARMRFADLTMDLDTREVRRANALLNLTRTEFAILECLMRSAGRVVTRDRLIDIVWGDREISSNNLEVFIRFLRAKVDPPDSRKLIQTERGVGYSLKESG
ncbi:MAG TPA: response regulator transcription factor [Bryobacteraceae bacterium]|jgi:DNA-binding response OmpR family regulator